ncbi:aspartyl protease family protein [Luteimonas sp. R10]|uniref:aspartyl protease family protein n=1 Tax=Luteimonas sp. R10 TaxID=3108176 RepID=UPI003091E269|nr:pepsin/retropepsin-like aspartic protease family protein [Luteimonas sp. R10]
MPTFPCSTSPLPRFRRYGVPLFLCLLLALAPRAMAQAAGEAPPLPAAQAEALLADARKGEVFALEAASPRIADLQLAALARARIAASRLQDDAALRALAPFFSGQDADPRHRRIAWSIAADAGFAAGDYARAAEATGAWQALLAAHGDPDGRAADVAQFHGIATQLAAVPPQAVLAFAPETVATRRDEVGLLRATMTVNGAAQEAVLDTGANLSVVSASTARRLGLRLLEGEGSVGSGSRDAVATRLGVAERLEFAGLALSNVVFLVLDDAQLEMPVAGGYRIDAILGFPVMRALRRIRFDADGRLTPEPVAGGDADDLPGDLPGNLRVVGSDLYVDVSVNGIAVPLHLDTGAPHSSLSSRFAQRHAPLLQGLPQERQRVGGAGGTTERRIATWPDVRVRVDAREMRLPELAIATADSADVETRNMGILGGDVLAAFASFTIDFARMRFELGEPVDATRASPPVGASPPASDAVD